MTTSSNPISNPSSSSPSLNNTRFGFDIGEVCLGCQFNPISNSQRESAARLFNMSQRCLCCGPIAAQASRIDKYWLSREKTPGVLAHNDRHTMVLCCNCLGQQNFECAMDFMDRGYRLVSLKSTHGCWHCVHYITITPKAYCHQVMTLRCSVV